jgi:hypothetical protein
MRQFVLLDIAVNLRADLRRTDERAAARRLAGQAVASVGRGGKRGPAQGLRAPNSA